MSKKSQHEDYWGRCWAVALERHMEAEIRPARPNKDPPDIDFHIRRRDGSVVTCWGEVTGTYYDSIEARWLWRAETANGGRIYWEPNAVMGSKARELVERKRKKYHELVERRGRGHLLVLLHSPLTSRSTRVNAEEALLDLLKTGSSQDFDPFETVWLGYRLPITSPDEREDPQHAFLDDPDGDRFNFLKCIWTRPIR